MLGVTQPALLSISISPANSSVALGTSQQLTATGQYTDGSTFDLTTAVGWSSTVPTIATVSAQGLASGASIGSTTVVASLGSVVGSGVLNVTAAILVSISVSPAIPAIPLGTQQQFIAIGTFSDGHTQDLTLVVQWTSDTTSVATIGSGAGLTGIAQATGVGSTSIAASLGPITGGTTLSVTAAALISIVVTPADASIPLGTLQQFKATGTFTDGTSQDLTASATWSSDASATASVNSSGLATGVGLGTSTIGATSGSTAGTALLTVSPATLVSISVSPEASSIPLGTTQQFIATGTYTDNSLQDVSALVHWSAGDGTVSTISNSVPTQGLATSVAQGNVSVVAALNAASGSAGLTVTPASLLSLVISPSAPTLAVGGSLQFTVVGTFSDQTFRDLTSLVQWSAGDGTVAVITGPTPGLANAIAPGSVLVVAAFNEFSTSATLTVIPASLVSIVVTPALPSLAVGATQQFTALGIFSDGSSQDLTAMAQWSAADETVAIISNISPLQGLATAVGAGTVAITSSFNGILGSTNVTVTPATLVFVSITPSGATISIGATQQFLLRGTYTDDSTQDLTSLASWSSSVPTFASVQQGLANGLAPGSTLISAVYSSLSASAQVNVTSSLPVLVSLQLSPEAPTISVEATQQLTAVGSFSDGTTQDLTSSVTWVSSDSTILAIQNTGQSDPGLCTGMKAGSAIVAADLGGVTASRCKSRQ